MKREAYRRIVLVGLALRAAPAASIACLVDDDDPAFEAEPMDDDSAVCAGECVDPNISGEMPPSTVVVLPDTQFYACAYPEVFAAQTRFVVEQQRARGIGLVLHTGDIVDKNIDAQWEVAGASMHALDGAVPYLVTSGNHDLTAERGSRMSGHFDSSLLDVFAGEAGAYDPPNVDNSYAVVDIGGRSWLFIGLEFGPRDAVVAWADEVLRRHSDAPTVLFTHAYLGGDGMRYDRTRPEEQPYHPDLYGLTPEQGINDGEDLWRKLVEPNENVRIVLSGHVIPDGLARSVATRASGGVVHQVMANYQQCATCPCAQAEGGGGFLRLLTFVNNGSQLHVSTYSPHLDLWLHDRDNEFNLQLEL